MSPPRPRGPRRHGHERGSSLLFALVFLLIIGLLAAALVTMASTGAQTNRAYRQQRALRYNAESVLHLTVLRVANSPTEGRVAGDCSYSAGMRQDTSGGTRPAFHPDSRLQVVCGPTPDSPFGDPMLPDVDGGQKTRDVTITVVCHDVTPADSEVIKCSFGGGNERVLAKARVRFEPDYTVADQKQRAVVPKIVTWDLLVGK